MLGAGIEAQVAHLLAAKRTPRDHALNGFFQNALRKATFQNLRRRDALNPTGIARVLIIDLLAELAAGEAHLIRIDDDDIVTAIDVRGIAWLMLAAQDVGDNGGNATNDETIGVNQMPLLFDLCRLCRFGHTGERLHKSASS